MQITHAKVSGIADDPADLAAGKMVPSHWNANHVITGKLKVGQAGIPALAVRKWLSSQVMPTPPTVTFTTTNNHSSGRMWPTVTDPNGDATLVVQTSPFAVSGAFKPVAYGTTYPNYLYVTWNSVDAKANKGYTFSRVVFQHVGTRLVYFCKGVTGFLLAKVDGQYVSLTPQTVPNDGNLYYWDFLFGSAASREFEILSYNVPFGGVFTALTDSIVPGALRGPRTVVISDSWGEGTGATYASTSSLWARAMDALGWNNFFMDAVGGTGLLANVSSTKYNYYERFLTDVVPVNPELVLVQASVNDDAFSTSALITQAQALITLCNAQLPNAQIMFTSELLRFGATFAGSGPFLRAAAFRSAVLAAGGLFVNLVEMPLQGTALTGALGAAASAGATSLTVTTPALQGGHYAFADSTRFMVKTCLGSGPYTVTTDSGGIGAAQSSGATFTQVGDSPIVGTGKVGATTGFGNADVLILSDGAHPTQSGHDFYGDLLGRQIAAVLNGE